MKINLQTFGESLHVSMSYLRKSAFSFMNAIKTQHRSHLTGQLLESCLKIALSLRDSYFETFAALIQNHVSSN